MEDMDARIGRVVDEMAGNEALLEMLETDAALEMLEWGKTLAASVVKDTEGLDDAAADEAMSPRLKAVRQLLRSAGNWAAGKYTDPASRVQLREKLLQCCELIVGDRTKLPTAENLDAVLNEVDDINNTPLQLILKLKTLLQGSIDLSGN